MKSPDFSKDFCLLSWKLETVFTVLSQNKINWVKYGGMKLLAGIVKTCLFTDTSNVFKWLLYAVFA